MPGRLGWNALSPNGNRDFATAASRDLLDRNTGIFCLRPPSMASRLRVLFRTATPAPFLARGRGHASSLLPRSSDRLFTLSLVLATLRRLQVADDSAQASRAVREPRASSQGWRVRDNCQRRVILQTETRERRGVQYIVRVRQLSIPCAFFHWALVRHNAEPVCALPGVAPLNTERVLLRSERCKWRARGPPRLRR